MALLSIYDSTSVLMPDGLPSWQWSYDQNGNAPGTPSYDPNKATWLGKTFTFTGGAPQMMTINDDDAAFEDEYVETGGAQTLAQDITLNGVTYTAGSIVQNEFSLVDAAGNEVWVVRIGDVNVGFAISDSFGAIAPGTTFTPVEARDGHPSGSTDGISSTTTYADVACFTADMPIDTPTGPRRAGSLRAGDLVTTRDSGPMPLMWTGRTQVDLGGPADPRRPIRIAPDAIAPGQPRHVVTLSPQHRVLVRIEGEDRLVPVRGLLPLPGVSVIRGRRSASYVHLLLATHEVLCVGGLPCESLYPGPMALAALRGTLSGAPEGSALRAPPLPRATARPCLTRRAAADWARGRQPSLR